MNDKLIQAVPGQKRLPSECHAGGPKKRIRLSSGPEPTVPIKPDLQAHSENDTYPIRADDELVTTQYHKNAVKQPKYSPILVSPTNPLPPRRPPQVAIPPLPFPPAKRAGRRGDFCPKTRHLTAAEVESLLPGSMFDCGRHVMQRGYWSVADEKVLRRSWNWADERVLADVGTPRCEIGVWAIMADLYRCTPRDLFRYGVRWVPDSERRDDHECFHQVLMRLLPHPFFRKNLAILRAALQVAVTYRIGEKSHVPPLGPGWSRELPTFVRWLDEIAPEYRGLSWYRDRSRVAEMRWTTQVLRQLSNNTRDNALVEPGPEFHGVLAAYYRRLQAPVEDKPLPRASWTDRILFRVQTVDLYALEFTLNSLFVQWPGGHTVYEYFANYWATLDQAGTGEHERVGPVDRAEVKAQKRLAVLADRREALVRARMHAAGDLYQLLDIPPFDPDPGFHHWEVCRRGIRTDLGPLLALQCTSVLVPSTMEWLARRVKGEACIRIERDIAAAELISRNRRPTTSWGLFGGPDCRGPLSTSSVYSSRSLWRSYLADSLSPRANFHWAHCIVNSRQSGIRSDYKYNQIDNLLLIQGMDSSGSGSGGYTVEALLQQAEYFLEQSASASEMASEDMLSLTPSLRGSWFGENVRETSQEQNRSRALSVSDLCVSLDALAQLPAAQHLKSASANASLPLQKRRKGFEAPLKVWV
ncbi:hypothetical protein GQ53DRAFT_830278 [Thozetella sp. PMI_491]|nr:hypothetical protein GQ53DRAFT_830278 [Thozetella sp. PMI_491]